MRENRPRKSTMSFRKQCCWCLLISFLLLIGPVRHALGDGALKWKFQTGGGGVTSPAIGPDGTIYVGADNQNYLYAVNPDGTMKWQFQVGLGPSSLIIGSDGTIYFSSSSYLYAINPDSTLKWEIPAPARILAVGSDGTLYTASGNNLYARNAVGGIKWQYHTSGSIIAAAIGSDGSAYVDSDDCGSEVWYMYAFNPSGNLKWSIQVPTPGYGNSCYGGPPTIGADGTIYVSGWLFSAINPADGSLRWRFSDNSMWSSSAVGSDGTLYMVGNTAGWYAFYAFNPDGTIKWRVSTPSYIGTSTPAIGSDGTIYVGERDGFLYAVNSDGTLKWTFPIGSTDSSPAIGLDGTVYIGSSDGNLYAINSNSIGLAKSSWPMFQHDPRRTACTGTAISTAAYYFGLNPISGYSPEPVNTALGNYTYQRTDLKLAGNPGLELKRAYNSQDTYQGPFGYGWTHSYNIFLSVSGSSATIKYADGHEEQYTANANGTFIPTRGGIYSSLVKNPDGTYTVKDKTQKVYIFGSDGKLSSIVDKNGNTVRMAYKGGNLTSVTDPAGRNLSLTYDSSNRILGIADPLGRTLAYSYDASGNLAFYTDANGGKWRYQYDSSHEVTSIINPLGNVLVANTYSNSKVVSQANGLGNSTTFQYDTPNPGDTTITSPMGKKTIHTHDSKYELIKVVNPLGQTISYTYDSNGNRTQITDVRGNVTQYAYDTMGNITSKTDVLGNITSISYDALNDPLTWTDALGHNTTFAYDSKGNLISIRDALGNVTTFTYTPSGEIASITNAKGYTSTFSYDAVGNLIKARDALEHLTTYAYDAAGRKTTQIDADGQKTTYFYDGNDNLLSVIDPNGKTAVFAYDLDNNRISVTDKKGVTTGYAYNALDELITVASPDTGVTLITYDPDQEVQTKTDGNGITTTYGHDAAGRVTAIVFPDASQNITLSYDASSSQTGFLTGVADPSGVTAYQYDSLGRIVKKTATVLGVTYATGYQYDTVGNLISETYPSGRQVTYALNAVNLPVGVNESKSNGVIPMASGISYDKVRNLLALTFGNGVIMQREYDAMNHLFQMSVSHVLNLGYLRDPMGNITTLDDLTKIRNFETFSYDGLYRLMTAQGPWGNRTYTYDANGNRVAETRSRTTDRSAYQGNLLLAISAGRYIETLKYDPNGNITEDGDFDFVYDQSNHLANVMKERRVLGQYAYNWKGQRVIKKVVGNRYTVFHYDLAGRLMEESNAKGQLISDYIYLGQNPLALVKPEGRKEEAVYFYHNDHLGAPKAMTDQHKMIVWTAEFDPFGNMVSSFESIENNLRFPGQYFDNETGLNYNNNRYYNPKTGRYTQADPIGLLGGMNRYIYALNNPVMMVDSMGLSAQEGGISSSSGLTAAQRAYYDQIIQQDLAQAAYYQSIANLIPGIEKRVILYTGGAIVTLATFGLGTVGVVGLPATAGLVPLVKTIVGGAFDIWDVSQQTVISNAVSSGFSLYELYRTLTDIVPGS